MKNLTRMLVISCVVLLAAGASVAQTGTMALYSDEAGTDCNVYDAGTGVIQVFVIYRGPTRTTASEFKLEQRDGAALTYLGESLNVPGGAFGKANTGIAIGYGSCMEEPVLVLTVTYAGLGVSSFCSKLCIVPHPEATSYNGDNIKMVDCQFSVVWADPGHVVINPDDDCECEVDPGDAPSPTFETSWGRIKSLYNG
jgi:hypothetical protein